MLTENQHWHSGWIMIITLFSLYIYLSLTVGKTACEAVWKECRCRVLYLFSAKLVLFCFKFQMKVTANFLHPS